jgi:hypothetical protein
MLRKIDWARSFALAKQAFSSVVEERDILKRECEWMQDQLISITAELRALRATVLARHRAEAELATLYRERDIQRADAVQRDPTKLLH